MASMWSSSTILIDDDVNSIGMLLEHIARVEEDYQIGTSGHDPTEEGGTHMRIGADLGHATREQVRIHDLSYYLERLDRVRARTLE